MKPSLKKSDVAVHLTKTEWELLRTFLKHAGKNVTHQQLFVPCGAIHRATCSSICAFTFAVCVARWSLIPSGLD